MNTKLRIAFFGRGNLGLRVLSRLLEIKQVTVSLIITCDSSNDVPLGREPFRELAKQNSIHYLETNHINTPQVCKIISDHSIDLGVAMLWLYTIKAMVFDCIKYGIINLHGGLLPRYRGNACQTWAILSGERKIGVTCHLMKPDELDSGPVINQKSFYIHENEKVMDLILKVSRIGEDLVIASVMQFVGGNFNATPQDDSISLYCYPRLPRDGEINWHDSAQNILKLINAAGPPYPGAYSFYRGKLDGKLYKMIILSARIVKYPKGEFLAVPGHIIKLPHKNDCAVVCGDKNLLVLDRIQIDGEEVLAIEAIRSVRQRLGLDISTEISNIWQVLQKIDK